MRASVFAVGVVVLWLLVVGLLLLTPMSMGRVLVMVIPLAVVWFVVGLMFVKRSE